jgi:hypothetical protein
MQLIPKTLISNFGGAHFRNARSVMFHPQECEALEALAKVMSTGYVSLLTVTSILPSYDSLIIIIYVMFRLVVSTSQGWLIQMLVRLKC